MISRAAQQTAIALVIIICLPFYALWIFGGWIADKIGQRNNSEKGRYNGGK